MLGMHYRLLILVFTLGCATLAAGIFLLPQASAPVSAVSLQAALVATLTLATLLALAFLVRRNLQRQQRHIGVSAPYSQAIFEYAPIGILQLTAKRIIHSANRTVEQYLGYQTNELSSFTLDELIHPDDVKKYRANMDAIDSRGKTRADCEIRLQTKSQQPLWVQLGLAAIRTDASHEHAYVATINNIQATKRFESLVSASEKKFRVITNTIESVVWMSTPGIGRMLYVNNAYEKIWGCSCDALYANPRSFIDAVHPDDRARVADTFTQHAHGDWAVKYRIVRPDGELRYIRDTGSAVCDDDGTLQYLIGTAIDITLEVTLQNRMREMVNQLQTANDRLEQLIKIDPLTQCWTRQVLMDEMEKELSRFKRYDTPSTLVFIDLDKFKDINDRYGHTVGDTALRVTADTIRHQIRETDVLARYAGDEFVLLLKQSTLEAAQAVVEKLRATPIVVSSPENPAVSVSASFGVAQLNPDITSLTAWIHHADQAMYREKSA